MAEASLTGASAFLIVLKGCLIVKATGIAHYNLNLVRKTHLIMRNFIQIINSEKIMLALIKIADII